MLRNPVDRAYSNYLWSRKNGLETEDFAEALELEGDREKTLTPNLRYARPHAYFSRGLYANLLKPYYDYFPADQILCLRFEDIFEKSRELAVKIHRFLGVEPRPNDPLELGVINESDPTAPVMKPEIQADLQRRYREANLHLALLLGEEFWPEDVDSQ
jgi:Sulfotransferase domain